MPDRWPAFVTAYIDRAVEFRGLWFSRVSDETRWTVTFRRVSDGEIVETPYHDTPVRAVIAAMSGCSSCGEESRADGG